MGLTRILALGVIVAGLRKAKGRRRLASERSQPSETVRSSREGRGKAADPSDTPGQQGRGRSARRPSDISSQGWKDVLYRVKEQLADDNITLVAAGVAFFGLMALAPALAGLVSLYGLFASPADIQGHFQNLIGAVPEQARQLLLDQVERIASNSDTSLTFAAVGALLLTILSAMKGSKALITAANIAYDERERRSFFRLNLVAVMLTLTGLVFALMALALIAAFPVIVDALPLPEAVRSALGLLRWPFMAGLMIVGLAAFYRYVPYRSSPKWRWVTWGSALATILWMVGSVLFSVYVGTFGKYNETYGSLGAVVVLLMWFYLSAFVVLLGAELNAEMEHQTARDSTTGPAAPLGQRGAYVADTIGEPRPSGR